MILEQPILKPFPKENKYILQKDYMVIYGDLIFVVPEGYIYNGTSVPRFAWSSIYSPYSPLCIAASLPHDHLYSTHEVSKKLADQIFYDRLILNGANKFKAKLMHQAVKVFGGFAW